MTEVHHNVRGARCHLAGFNRIVDADEISRGVDYHRGADGIGAIGNSHQGWSFVEFGGDVAHGLGAVVAEACSEGNRTSRGRWRDEGVDGMRSPHHSGKGCDGGQ